MIQPDPWDRGRGWYVTTQTADTAWPYVRAVLLSGPHDLRPPVDGEHTRVRFWDGKVWRKTDGTQQESR